MTTMPARFTPSACPSSWRCAASSALRRKPPVIRVLSPSYGSARDDAELALVYSARSDTGPIDRVEVRIDGRPAEVLGERLLSEQDGGRQRVGQLRLRLPPEHATVGLLAYNANGASVAAEHHSVWTGTETSHLPDLYVLAVGVGDHPTPAARLDYADDDARDLGARLKAQRGGLYDQVFVRTLTDAEATRAAILRGLKWLRDRPKQQDLAVLFLSGHGFRASGMDGHYFFLPYDGEVLDVDVTGVPGDAFRRYLRKVKARTVLLLDTCYAGALEQDGDPEKNAAGRDATAAKLLDTLPDLTRFANELADPENGVIVFASSDAGQVSLEHEDWQNGAFTEALLEALAGRAHTASPDRRLRVRDLEDYLKQRVAELTQSRQTPVVTKPSAVDDYPLLRVITR